MPEIRVMGEPRIVSRLMPLLTKTFNSTNDKITLILNYGISVKSNMLKGGDFVLHQLYRSDYILDSKVSVTPIGLLSSNDQSNYPLSIIIDEGSISKYNSFLRYSIESGYYPLIYIQLLSDSVSFRIFPQMFYAFKYFLRTSKFKVDYLKLKGKRRINKKNLENPFLCGRIAGIIANVINEYSYLTLRSTTTNNINLINENTRLSYMVYPPWVYEVITPDISMEDMFLKILSNKKIIIPIRQGYFSPNWLPHERVIYFKDKSEDKLEFFENNNEGDRHLIRNLRLRGINIHNNKDLVYYYEYIMDEYGYTRYDILQAGVFYMSSYLNSNDLVRIERQI